MVDTPFLYGSYVTKSPPLTHMICILLGRREEFVKNELILENEDANEEDSHENGDLNKDEVEEEEDADFQSDTAPLISQ